jgi:hypothetical protein
MGRLRQRAGLAIGLAVWLTLLQAGSVGAFSGFGSMTATATYGVGMTFTVQLPGGAPDRLELLLRFGGSDEAFVAPVSAGASSATYTWDSTTRGITPNTPVAYQWRATAGDSVTLSAQGSLLYDDDRPGLNWHAARIGDTTLHWYGGAESQARKFGTISAEAASAAEKILGHSLDGPIDLFVYSTHDDFFGALGPGAREWTGAATFPELRTVFMWLGAGSSSYLEQTVRHEVTHVVFYDATHNPFHQPATWFNEGLAVWSQSDSSAAQHTTVEAAAASGLIAFQGISESFPISADGAALSYAEGTTMVQMIMDRYGRDAIAAIAAAWRSGDGDDDALQAGTGVSAAKLYADYFAEFGVDPPQPVSPAPIPASNVDLPPQPPAGSGGPASQASPSPSEAPLPTQGDAAGVAILLGVILVVAVAGGALLVLRRRGGRVQ